MQRVHYDSPIIHVVILSSPAIELIGEAVDGKKLMRLKRGSTTKYSRIRHTENTTVWVRYVCGAL